MFHRTDRLLLRPVWKEDWQAIYGGIADEGVVRNLARAPWPYRAEDAQAFVELPRDPMSPRFLITRAANAQLIGCIGIDRTGDGVELGYWIGRPYWGQGFATEAGRAVIEIARMLGHDELVASHFLDNPASGSVLTKLGFAPTGAIAMRHSCGRGEEAPTAEYRLSLGQDSAFSGPAASSQAA